MPRLRHGALGAILLVPFACSGSSSPAVGTWTIDSKATFDAVSAELKASVPEAQQAMMLQMMQGVMDSMQVEFTLNGDQTFASTMKASPPPIPGAAAKAEAQDVKGTWQADGNSITLTTTHFDGKERVEKMTGTLDGATLKIVDNSQGKPMTLVLKRK
jgi:hypothetical protein